MDKIIILEERDSITTVDEQELTLRIISTIDRWPGWKKEAYNNNFAISNYSAKLVTELT